MGSGSYLKRSQEKYGLENFTKEILAVFDNPDSMFEMESILVNEEFVRRTNTYNLKEGGFGGWPPNAIASYTKRRKENLELNDMFIEQRRRCGKMAHIRRKSSKELDDIFRENCRLAFKGRTHTEEAKRAIGKANSIHQQGINNSQYGTMWITTGLDNKRIKKTDSIPDGWRKGRTLSLTGEKGGI